MLFPKHSDLLGIDEEIEAFIYDSYLPVLEKHIGHIDLDLLESAELLENTIGTVIKLLYAFVWQENVIDLGGTFITEIFVLDNLSSGLNLSPAANEAGAAFTPKLNMFANNLTRWDLFIDDVQVCQF